MKVFSIHDTKAEAFMQPFYAQNVAMAGRMIDQASSDPNSALGKYPTEFQLYIVAEWDEKRGEITPTPHKNLGFVSDFMTNRKDK